MGRHSRKRRGGSSASSDTTEGAAGADGAPRAPGAGPAGAQRPSGAQRPPGAPQPPGRGGSPRGATYGGAPYGGAHGGPYGPGQAYGPGPGGRRTGPGAGPGGSRGGPPAEGPGTPAHGSNLFGGPGPGTPPGGVPGVSPARGGHPQHREPGGGWGANGAGQGPPTGGLPRVGPAPGQGPPSGPRQEYLDAFDDTSDDVFAAGAPEPRIPGQRREQRHAPSEHGDERAVHPLDERPPSGPVRGGQAPPDRDEPYAPLAPIGPGEEKGGRTRTLTGAAAAAVTTVLAVVIAGQVIGGDPGRDTRAASTGVDRGSDEDASRSDDRPDDPAERPSKPAAPRTYEDKMAAVVPLDPKLKGPGSFAAVPGRQKGAEGGEVMRYRVDVEKELPLDAELFAQAVHTTLNDERSWAHDDARSFERVSSGDADFVITLASPGTTAEWCAKSGLDTRDQNVSCDSAATERIMINAWRWARGSKTFGDELIAEYRQMLINHEVGHRLGRDHLGCDKQGKLAPVMMQQTKSLTTDGETCRPNPWPHPRG
ncbi:DUF3152 domain-containing protein [Streptomyces armeniacus]|uniref:DUF3152 domain-containing protein n=1 Tax=Streptomyces armeniacus TaxID=83291 RepID=A0A345XIU1_9ACTN|nr:DUF3152 domain-containing protein [Streptomyces armeniacus]AXK31557.1 DUF3152 domain-containing protein [Streptomyces armeniacus]